MSLASTLLAAGAPAAGGGAELVVGYRLSAADGKTATALAAALAREQTVEMPAGIVDAEREAVALGRVLAVEPEGAADGSAGGAAGRTGGWRVRIAYPLDTVRGQGGVDLPQLLNVLFGNVSLWQGVALTEVVWPEAVLTDLPGPRQGIAGLRRRCGVPRRPLLCGALKPMGLSARELATLAARAAEAGVDLVKDDHGIADQPWAPWEERVARCAEAVAEAAARRGGTTLYLPNLSGPLGRLPGRLARLAELGVGAAMVAPAVIGLETVRWLASEAEGADALALIGHPAMSGSWLAGSGRGLAGAAASGTAADAGAGAAAGDHGFAAGLLWGELFRLVGCDGVIYPNAGGRFPIAASTVEAVHRRLRAPLGAHRPAFPMLGGGITIEGVGGWVERFGPDTVFLIGGAIYRAADPRAAAQRVMAQLERWA